MSPVECLLCLPVLQIYRDCVYLHRKFLVTAGICRLCVYFVVTGPFCLVAVAAMVAVAAIVTVILTGQVVVAAVSKTMLSL